MRALGFVLVVLLGICLTRTEGAFWSKSQTFFKSLKHILGDRIERGKASLCGAWLLWPLASLSEVRKVIFWSVLCSQVIPPSSPTVNLMNSLHQSFVLSVPLYIIRSPRVCTSWHMYAIMHHTFFFSPKIHYNSSFVAVLAIWDKKSYPILIDIFISSCLNFCDNIIKQVRNFR